MARNASHLSEPRDQPKVDFAGLFRYRCASHLVASPRKNTVMYYVYVLHSKKDKKLYTGYSKDLERRFSEHTHGKVASTKDRLPLNLIYYEAYLYEEDAKGRELFLKGGSGKKYLKRQLFHYFKAHPWLA